jgi:hypothetical protein
MFLTITLNLEKQIPNLDSYQHKKGMVILLFFLFHLHVVTYPKKINK